MPTQAEITEIANLAETLYQGLTSENDFTLPNVDFSQTQFLVPSSVENPLYDDVPRIDFTNVTSGDPQGTGIFDKLMQSLNAQLTTQFEKQRITGKEYAEVYIAMVQGAMQTATQFALQEEQIYWQNIIAQKQAQGAEISVVTERVNLETGKARLRQAQNEALMSAANYALSKMQLLQSDAQLDLIEGQVRQIDYQVDFMMPKQVDQIQKQIEVSSKQIGQIEAQTAQTVYETTSLLPKQADNLLADKFLKQYQLSDQLPATVAGITADTAGKLFQNANILPAQLVNLKEQGEGYRAQTLDTRSNGVTQVSGAVGMQKKLQQQQIDSYRRDAEQKVAKMIVDTWITQKSVDEGLVAPEQFRDLNINQIFTKMRNNLDL